MYSENGVELQLVSQLGDRRAWDHCRRRATAGERIQVVLLHDAVLETEATISEALGEVDSTRLVVMACAEDARRRQVEERWPLIDYQGIIASCAGAARVVSW
ncbi:MAG: hypothetical protein ABSF27_04910 [Candidatus Dormibacteria bacterium]